MGAEPFRSPPRSPFAFPAYRALWFANLACNAAVLVQSVGASWALVEQDASPQLVALVQTALSLPLMLISPLSGAICDAFDRRKVMIGAQLVLCAVALVLAFASAQGWSSAPVVLACMFLAGSSLAFNGPAFMASVSDTVPRERLPEAVLANAVGLNVARSVGPAAGGLLLAVSGVASNYLVAAAIALLLMLVLYRWRPDFGEDGRAQPPLAEPLIGAIGQGFRFALETPPIKASILRAMLFTAAFSGLQALIPLVASRVLAGGPDLYGTLYASFGVGALGGALLGARVRRKLGGEVILRGCIVLLALSNLLVAFSPFVPLTMSALALSGAGWVLALSIFNTTIQMASPRRIGGRTLSLYQMAVFSGVATGSWISGLLADAAGTLVSLFALAVLGLGSVLVGRWLPIPDQRRDTLS
ncbi:MFS transporter [Novosphingobium mangrovi (ex Hu et al. 2023)]|uniref:MFS transporter n=1 Tax=Novosphingobium mangrovi (ex Hu et al. 2023) TaxID=2930094 RepID=A0ABT0AEG8_9SPHN|nr:MFS transporter [Novosphingobium mangrovi (ex Hu et al. 2023)]MCJ1961590.1 MFS transporter [Novosphingobium mangrovi (ex Hu et al. 2023)]